MFLDILFVLGFFVYSDLTFFSDWDIHFFYHPFSTWNSLSFLGLHCWQDSEVTVSFDWFFNYNLGSFIHSISNFMSWTVSSFYSTFSVLSQILLMDLLAAFLPTIFEHIHNVKPLLFYSSILHFSGIILVQLLGSSEDILSLLLFMVFYSGI